MPPRKKPSAPAASRYSVIRFALALYLLALLPRIVFVLLAGRADLSLDEIEYHLLATNLAKGNGFRWFFDLKSSFRPPGYPFCLAALYYFTGPNYFLARLVQTFLVATTGVLTWGLGRQLMTESAARLAGIIIALYPPLIFYTVALMGENLFIPLLLLGLYCLVRPSSSPIPHSQFILHPLLSALSFGLAILIRPELTYLLPFVLAWLYLVTRRRQTATRTDTDEHGRKRGHGATASSSGVEPRASSSQPHFALRTTLFLVLLALIITPWVIRNYHVTGRFVYLDTRTGYNLYLGYNDRANGTFDMMRAQDLIDAFIKENLARIDLPKPLTEAQVRNLLYREVMAYKQPGRLDYPLRKQFDPDSALSDVVMNDWGMARAKEFIQEHPLRALALLPLKFAYFWDLEHRIFLFAYSNNFIGPLPRPLLALFFLLLLAPFPLLVLLSILHVTLKPPPATHPETSTLKSQCQTSQAPDFPFLIPHSSFLILPIVFYALLHTLTFGEARFHYVILPFLALLAAQTLTRLRTTRKSRSPVSSIPHSPFFLHPSSFILLLLFLLIWAHGLYASWDHWLAVFGPNGHQSYLEF